MNKNMNPGGEEDENEKLVQELMEEFTMGELYESKNPLVSHVHNSRIDKVIKLIPKKPNLRILDAGCGEGQLLEKIFKIPALKSSELYGVDFTDAALKDAEKRAKTAKISKQNLKNLNYKDNFFDVIVCTEVIEHIPEYQKAINELKRVLKKGGTFIITFPNEPLWTVSRFFLGRKPAKLQDHFNSFSPNMMINSVGLKIKKKVNVPFHLPPMLALTRIISFEK